MRTRVGYCGGTSLNPTYRSIGDHTEAISIDYDPNVIAYEQFLNLFWGRHRSPSSASRGQYMHAIFTRDERQRELAEKSMSVHAEGLGVALIDVGPRVAPITRFTLAEHYHQKYRISQSDGLREFLSTTYPGIKAFADSTVATRINTMLGAGLGESAPRVLEEVSQFGLPEPLEKRLRQRLGIR